MINEATTLQELAAVVSAALETAGITATLSGGAAVTIYSDNAYESADLDFVTSERNKVLENVIEKLGFARSGSSRMFEHPDTDWYVEFPPGTWSPPRTQRHLHCTLALMLTFTELFLTNPYLRVSGFLSEVTYEKIRTTY